jgi:hypothetical protein
MFPPAPPAGNAHQAEAHNLRYDFPVEQPNCSCALPAASRVAPEINPRMA